MTETDCICIIRDLWTNIFDNLKKIGKFFHFSKNSFTKLSSFTYTRRNMYTFEEEEIVLKLTKIVKLTSYA